MRGGDCFGGAGGMRLRFLAFSDRAPLNRRPVRLPRSSGILLHPTSLPGGRLDDHAYAFVDWLAAAGQSWWQVLPLGPPDPTGSPYTAASAFAGWNGLLAEPAAPVAADELEGFV